ncbi:hypothetical protein SPRG_02084 [Saprolegnia parasitica CBS 223.65]|uniref:Cytochrome P450 n=1 Tax=Saprolegnia parasitica (strain CBS 223.65) TaxID=695850 RepID=A0A067CS09_SAPPC|nr:hypothetical protein SPRG_02084 [Saprolegnia parasitica CBS 223.65]KDO33273.1 hypothetical protein SPRG_02084 [Saprolegnia parasitica CBS 223.65]|eukprot:XP_012196027.1 hypothetical protein SPRG_02084 [Saprolegnia parasitica CBS 223.65]
MTYEVGLAVGIAVASALFYVGFRAPSLRMVILNTLAFLKGVPVVWVDSPALAAKVFKASTNKGVFIEHEFSEPAWLPAISMESIDDPRWSRMKANLVVLMKQLPSSADLQRITTAVTTEYVASHDVLCARGVVHITIASLFEWIFARPLPKDDADWIVDATNAWRMEIALKGKGDVALKQRFVDWTIAHIESTPTIYDLFGQQWRDAEYFSLILQPFFLSPSINISDIAVTVGSLVRRGEGETAPTDLIHKAIDMAHPFIIIERYLEHGLVVDGAMVIAPGTHVFVPIDNMTSDSAMRFGAGIRKCPGQFQGMALMLGIFQNDVITSPKFQPALHHNDMMT